MAYEPIAFFDFKDQEQIELDFRFRKSCKYIKLVPTAFRSLPINYADVKPYEKHQAECQFFGVAGYETESLLCQGSDPQT